MLAVTTDTQTKSFTATDTESLQAMQRRKLYGLVGKYSLVLAFLLLVCYLTQEGTIQIRGVAPEDIRLVLLCFIVFLAISLVVFFAKDYLAVMRPLQKELSTAKKECLHFPARRYYDPIYKHYLLFYPDIEDVYINISKEDFDRIADDELMYMEVAPVTESILLLRSKTHVIQGASEYRFR